MSEPLPVVDVPGWGKCRVYVCSSCGVESFLGPAIVSPGFGAVDEDAFTRLIIGDPPRCPDCRKQPGAVARPNRAARRRRRRR